MELDINEQNLSLNVPNLYQLDLKLPYPVLDQDGTAKFDKATKTMVIVLPVVPKMIEAPKLNLTVEEEETIQEEIDINELEDENSQQSNSTANKIIELQKEAEEVLKQRAVDVGEDKAFKDQNLNSDSTLLIPVIIPLQEVVKEQSIVNPLQPILEDMQQDPAWNSFLTDLV